MSIPAYLQSFCKCYRLRVIYIDLKTVKEITMCTAATYRSQDFYFGRTFDYEFNYGEEVVVTPRNYSFQLRHQNALTEHYAMIGIAHMEGIIRCIMMRSMKRVWVWQVLISRVTPYIVSPRRAETISHSSSSFPGSWDSVLRCRKHGRC